MTWKVVFIGFLILNTTDLENTSKKTTILPVPHLQIEAHDRLDTEKETVICLNTQAESLPKVILIIPQISLLVFHVIESFPTSATIKLKKLKDIAALTLKKKITY